MEKGTEYHYVCPELKEFVLPFEPVREARYSAVDHWTLSVVANLTTEFWIPSHRYRETNAPCMRARWAEKEVHFEEVGARDVEGWTDVTMATLGYILDSFHDMIDELLFIEGDFEEAWLCRASHAAHKFDLEHLERNLREYDEDWLERYFRQLNETTEFRQDGGPR